MLELFRCVTIFVLWYMILSDYKDKDKDNDKDKDKDILGTPPKSNPRDL